MNIRFSSLIRFIINKKKQGPGDQAGTSNKGVANSLFIMVKEPLEERGHVMCIQKYKNIGGGDYILAKETSCPTHPMPCLLLV